MTTSPPTAARTARTLRLTIPGAPPSELLPNRNRGKHWSVISKARKQQVHDAYYVTANHRLADLLPVKHATAWTVAITIHWDRRRKGHHSDGDSALSACKGLIDGIAQALELDDKCFTFAPVVQLDDESGIGFVDVEVTAND